MTEAFAKQIDTEARQAMTELVAAAKLKKGDVLKAVDGSLEHTNGLQHRVIETQSSLIKSLEEHNAELEKIIDDLTNI